MDNSAKAHAVFSAKIPSKKSDCNINLSENLFFVGKTLKKNALYPSTNHRVFYFYFVIECYPLNKKQQKK